MCVWRLCMYVSIPYPLSLHLTQSKPTLCSTLTLVCSVLPYLTQPYPTLPYPVVCCSHLPCSTLSSPTLYKPVQPYHTLLNPAIPALLSFTLSNSFQPCLTLLLPAYYTLPFHYTLTSLSHSESCPILLHGGLSVCNSVVSY